MYNPALPALVNFIIFKIITADYITLHLLPTTYNKDKLLISYIWLTAST